MPSSYLEAFELSVELHRSNHRRCSKTKGVLSILPATLLKERLWYRCFPMNFAKLLRTTILKNICERLLLAAGLRTTQKMNRRDCFFYLVLFILTFLQLVLFPFFIDDFLIHICFCFETKLANGKLFGKFGRFYNITSKNKTEFSECSGKYGHVEFAD